MSELEGDEIVIAESEDEEEKELYQSVFKTEESPVASSADVIEIVSSPEKSPEKKRLKVELLGDKSSEIGINRRCLEFQQRNCKVLPRIVGHFAGNSSFPMTEINDGEFSVTGTARILLTTNPTSDIVCQKSPKGAQQNSCFLVNITNLKDSRDVRADDLGTWRHNGVVTTYVRVNRSSKKEEEIFQHPKNFKPSKEDMADSDMFVMRRTYHANGTAPDFKRMIIEMEDHKGSLLPVCVLKYNFDGPEHNFEVAPHGNSKGRTGYMRTMPSTLDLLKKEAQSNTPKVAVEVVDDANGGIMEADSAGSLPRNRQQASNYRRSVPGSNERRRKNVKGLRDELSAVMEMCFNQSRTPETAFVRKVQGAPDTMCVLASDYQLRELERNATNPEAFKIVSVDPTFNLGAFDVTVMTFEHGLVISKRTGKNPVVMGPILVHRKKQFSNYFCFMSSLVGLKPSLSEIQAFGTDGEIALQQGLSKPCTNPRLLRCFGHFKKNCGDKLSALDIPKQFHGAFIRDIFGYNIGSTHHEGLVDSDSEEVFDAKLLSLEETWNNLEINANPLKVPSFHQWFCENKAKQIKDHMLPALRTEVGLGSPPEPYYQNKSESMNEVIKDQVKYTESELPEFIEKVSGIEERHKDLLRKAVARTGEWELLPGFRFLERPNWFKMTSQQREAHMKAVMRVELSEDRSLPMLIVPQPSSTQPLLSTGYDQIPNISTFTLKKMWKEAKELVTSPGYILPVAGSSCPFAKQVFNSKQPSKPLLVTRRPSKQSATNYVFECDPGCPQYSYLGLCCHTVATAESNKVLKEYVDFLEKNTAPPNLHQLSLKVSGRKGAGRKGSKPVRSRARAHEKQPVLDTTFSRNAETSSHSPNVEQGVKEISSEAASEDIASDSQQKHTAFPTNTSRSVEIQEETPTSSSKYVPYTGFLNIGSQSFSENRQDQQVATPPHLSPSDIHIRGTSFSRGQQQQQQPSTSSQLSPSDFHVRGTSFSRGQPSTSSQLAYDGFCTGVQSFASDGFSSGTIPLGDNHWPQQQQQQSSAFSQIDYAYPNLPTCSQQCQQPAPSFLGWLPYPCSTSELGIPDRFPQQQSYGELSSGRNKEAPSTWPSSSPKPGFPSPPEGVFYCYLLEFCPPQVSKCYGCSQGLKHEGQVAQAPFNLVIVTKMKREYYSNGEKKSKLSNVYFHCSSKCVRQKQPYFLSTMCKIPPELTPFLLPCHKDMLNNL